MTVTHSKSLTTLRKRQKRRKTQARLAKEAEKVVKPAGGTARKNTGGAEKAGG
jgi:hypothetical protein